MEITDAVTTSRLSGAESGSAALAENFDAFLTLLTTQLRHQDPLEPMDSSEFTNQLVQFTGVEQAIYTNKNLEQLLAMLATNQSSSLVNYRGKMVEVASDAATLEDGAAAWTYDLAATAEATQLLVLDVADRVVRVATGETAAGTHGFAWDGTDNAGQPVPAGSYRLTVSALDAAASPIETSVRTTGRVTRVETAGEQNLLTVGGVKVPLSDVLSVSMAEAN